MGTSDLGREAYFVYKIIQCEFGLEPKIDYLHPCDVFRSNFDGVVFFNTPEAAIKEGRKIHQRYWCGKGGSASPRRNFTEDPSKINIAVGKVFIYIDPLFFPIVIDINSE